MRLEALYSRVSVSGTLTEEIRSDRSAESPPARDDVARRPPNGQTAAVVRSTKSFKCTFKINNNLKKYHQALTVDRHFDESAQSLQDVKTSLDSSQSVTCAGRDYSFRLTWDKNIPILQSFGSTGDQYVKTILTRSIDDILGSTCGAFGAGVFMSQIMTFPSFSISRVTKITGQGGADKLLIEFEWDPADDKHPAIPRKGRNDNAAKGKPRQAPRKRGNWIEVSPNEGWVVQGNGLNRSRLWRGPRREIVYGEPRSGIPLPRRISIFHPESFRTLVLDIESIDFGPISESEFTLSSYGLPELDGSPRPGRGNRLAYGMFIGAFVLLSIALALKYYARRSGMTTTPA